MKKYSSFLDKDVHKKTEEKKEKNSSNNALALAKKYEHIAKNIPYQLAKTSSYVDRKLADITPETLTLLERHNIDYVKMLGSSNLQKNGIYTYALVNEKDKQQPIIIASRGTNDLASAIADFDPTAPGHYYLSDELDNIFKAIKAVQEKYPQRQLCFAGHSLGGALSQQLCMAFIDRKLKGEFSAVSSIDIVIYQSAGVSLQLYENAAAGIKALRNKHKDFGLNFVSSQIEGDLVPYTGYQLYADLDNNFVNNSLLIKPQGDRNRIKAHTDYFFKDKESKAISLDYQIHSNDSSDGLNLINFHYKCDMRPVIIQNVQKAFFDATKSDNKSASRVHEDDKEDYIHLEPKDDIAKSFIVTDIQKDHRKKHDNAFYRGNSKALVIIARHINDCNISTEDYKACDKDPKQFEDDAKGRLYNNYEHIKLAKLMQARDQLEFKNACCSKGNLISWLGRSKAHENYEMIFKNNESGISCPHDLTS